MVNIKEVFLVPFDKKMPNLYDLIWQTLMASVFTSHGLLYNNEFSLIAGGLIFPFTTTFFKLWEYLLSDLFTLKRISLVFLYMIILILLPVGVSSLISYIKSIFPENTIKLNYQVGGDTNYEPVEFPSQSIKNKLSVSEDFQLILYFVIIILSSLFVPISILNKDIKSLISLGTGVSIIAYLCIIGILSGYSKKEEQYYITNNKSLIIFIFLIICSLSVSYIIYFLFFETSLKKNLKKYSLKKVSYK
jgi:hypothetical protein